MQQQQEMNAPLALVQETQQILAGSYGFPGIDTLTVSHVLDIGACHGAFSIWAAKLWPKCHITAFEPNPEIRPMLRGNLAAMGIEDRVTVMEQALGGQAGEVVLHIGVNPGCTGVQTTEISRHTGRTVHVRQVAASALGVQADVIKVDTEGSEVEILQGFAAAGILGKAKVVAYEYHSWSDRPVLDELLQLNGFRLVAGWVESESLGTCIWRKAVGR